MTEETRILEGIGIGGYRSFGAHQRIGPLGKINLLAGQNNSGKSNILRFVCEPMSRLWKVGPGNNISFETEELDRHQGEALKLNFSYGIQLDGDIDRAIRNHDAMTPVRAAWQSVATRLADDGMVWIPHVVAPARTKDQRTVVLEKPWIEQSVEPRTNAGDWQTLSRHLANQTSNVSGNVGSVLGWIAREILPNAPSVLIPAVREIGNADGGDLSGNDLIRRLDELERPIAVAAAEDSARFRKVNDFVAWVTDTPDAMVSIPHTRDTINVRMGERLLPLENLGTGIHEVIMLAAWATIHENHVVCVEEPELHLHPLVQRKLIRYLAEHTSNQYLIATHSAHLLDFPEAHVFHVRHDGSQSVLTRSLTPSSRVDICADLGYRATDLLQANAIVWVEGPTDRLYVRHWLAACDHELIEGVHYSVMFYGGRLLSHLSADDEEVDAFIKLRRINQWVAMIIDSDRSKKGERLNATKLRLRDELADDHGFVWVTKGREIENYIPHEVLANAVAAVHPRATTSPPADEFDEVTTYRVGRREHAADKVKVAHEVVIETADLEVLDLRQKISGLARFIRRANGLDDRPRASSMITDTSSE